MEAGLLPTEWGQTKDHQVLISSIVFCLFFGFTSFPPIHFDFSFSELLFLRLFLVADFVDMLVRESERVLSNCEWLRVADQQRAASQEEGVEEADEQDLSRLSERLRSHWQL
jgi:hypothetical protein